MGRSGTDFELTPGMWPPFPKQGNSLLLPEVSSRCQDQDQEQQSSPLAPCYLGTPLICHHPFPVLLCLLVLVALFAQGQ